MPLKETERDTIIRLAREYGARKVWLFGSAIKETEYNDIDIGVEGLPGAKVYELFSRLFDALPKPVDLIDMDGENPIRHIIRDRGVIIYE